MNRMNEDNDVQIIDVGQHQRTPAVNNVRQLQPRRHPGTENEAEAIKTQVMEMFGDVLPVWIGERTGYPIQTIVDFILEQPHSVPRMKTQKRVALEMLEDEDDAPVAKRRIGSEPVIDEAVVLNEEEMEAEQGVWVSIATPCFSYRELFESNKHSHPDVREAVIADIVRSLTLKKYDCYGQRKHMPRHERAADEQEGFINLIKRSFPEVYLSQILKLKFEMNSLDTLLIMQLIEFGATDILYDLLGEETSYTPLGKHWLPKKNKAARETNDAPVPMHAARSWKKYHQLMTKHTNEMIFKDSDGSEKAFSLDVLHLEAIVDNVTTDFQKYECIVCFEAFRSLSDGVKCTNIETETERDTHWTCNACIGGYSKSLCNDGIVAKGGAGIPCSEHGCKGIMLWAHIRLLLDKETRNRMAKRLDHEAVLDVANLEKCKYCNFGMVIEASKEELKVFSCKRCEAEVCRICQRDFDDLHFGKRCDEAKGLEEKKEDRRKQLEEQLTTAVIRQCPKCKLQFEKDNGCNRMKCRCGLTQCYLCRKVEIDYTHFCNHVRDPNNPGVCPEKCNKCLLWENAEERDRRDRMDILANQARDELLREDDIDRLR